MQSRVYQELHQRRQATALVTGADAERTAFVTGLLEDALLIQDARTSFLANVRRAGITGPMFHLAAEEATATVLRAAFRRTDDLLNWREHLAPLAGWWGLQAMYEYNNSGRRHDERLVGYHRSSGTVLTLVSDHQPDEDGVLQPLPLVDEAADPAQRYERQVAATGLHVLLATAGEHPALKHLRDWLAAHALNADCPVTFHNGLASLSWAYGQQQALATRLGVSTRTLRNRAREVEALLTTLAAQVRARAA
ncbi:hypothetical protein GCM10010840_14560 [Deinococcus aerolatus]|uniref:Uncharacterized protein n=1 Tax=Deinococcus aerolatus TaxID=522487 RepID=A0ABQ2G6C9_9DEIO|nr:hypothetical protein [Deinococcus aerolatus]GGL77756.1 hypothetical protein GCM10010840_14560 [Deinococcus aerolatus]